MLGLGLGLTNFGTRGGVSDVPDALSGASSLLDGEDGLAIDFSDQSIAIRDTTTPANNIASAGTVRNGALVGPGAKLVYASPSPKLCKNADGTYGYRAQNLYLNSEAPANQSVTVVSGLPYIIAVTGTVSITLSGAATGTVTAGNPITFTASSGTLTCGSTSGAGTVHLRSTIAATDYIKTTGIPLYDLPYDWTGTYYYPLVEPAATNICLHSNDLTQSNWTKTSATAAKTATGLDGVANSASTLTASAANGVAVQNISSASATRSGSVFLKRRTGTGAVSIAIGETTGSNLVTNGTFDTDITGWTNSVPAAGNISHSSSAVLVERVSGGLSAYQAVTCTVGKLYRLTYAFTSVSGGASRAALTNSTGVIGAGDLTATGGSVFLATASTMYAHLSLNSGNGTSGRYDDVVVQEVVEATVDLSSGAWVRATIENKTITNPCVAIKLATSGDAVDVAYAQMETGSEATSPIITAGATVTRAADQPTIPTSAFPNVQAAITLYAEAVVRGSQSNGRLIQIDDGTPNEAHRAIRSSVNTANASTTNNSISQSYLSPATTGAFAIGATIKAAYAVQANSAQAAVNGTLGTEDTSLTMPTTTTLRLGHANGGGTQLAQHIKRVMVLPRRMSNAELQALTA